MKLTTISTFYNSIEANIAKSKLDDCEIPSFLTNENFTTLMPNFTGILSKGIELKVLEEDFEKAKEILKVDAEVSDVCPNCGSRDIKITLGKSKISKWFLILISMIFGMPFNNINGKKTCKNCGSEIES